MANPEIMIWMFMISFTSVSSHQNGNQPANSIINLDLSDNADGVYLIRITAGGESKQQRLFLPGEHGDMKLISIVITRQMINGN